jgi:hypothetical protein
VTKICKEIYELIEEYLKISSTEEDEIGMGITNEYLNEFSNKMNSLKSNYEGYNKSLVMNLSPYRADFFNPHIHMLSMNKWDIQVRALTPLNILSFS